LGVLSPAPLRPSCPGAGFDGAIPSADRLIADSVVLTAVNTRMVTAADFIRSGPAVGAEGEWTKGFLPCFRAAHGYAGAHSHVRVSSQLPAAVGDIGQGYSSISPFKYLASIPYLSPVDIAASAGVKRKSWRPLAPRKLKKINSLNATQPDCYAGSGRPVAASRKRQWKSLKIRVLNEALFPRWMHRGLISAQLKISF
jgi:hypothetical protein